jgi:hypothetical protein
MKNKTHTQIQYKSGSNSNHSYKNTPESTPGAKLTNYPKTKPDIPTSGAKGFVDLSSSSERQPWAEIENEQEVMNRNIISKKCAA